MSNPIFQVATDQLVQETFAINPTTVYGVFAAFMLIVIIVLSIAIYKLYQTVLSNQLQYIKLMREMTNVMEEIGRHYTPESRRDNREKIVSAIENVLTDHLKR